MTKNRTTVMIMAGGKGSRLGPLTCHRSKPSVPFASRYRIIDFVLSNFVNSDYGQIYVLTQYMASSLIEHLNRNWKSGDVGGFIDVVPAQMRTGNYWYRGTADSIYQNLNLIRDRANDCVAVFGGDHIYKCAIDQMEEQHRRLDADATIAAFPVPRSEASSFGVIDIDETGRVVGFLEKPEDPPGMPNRPDYSLVSMGNYFFKREVLEEALLRDHDDSNSVHDFGRNIIPTMVAEGKRVFIYDFATNTISGEPDGDAYWRDVGTIDSYFQANMDLRARLPLLNVYNRTWPIRAAQRHYPPARFVRSSSEGKPAEIIDSMVCEGAIVSSARVHESLLGYDCYIHSGSILERSIVLAGCDIGVDSKLRNVLLDKNCKIDRGVSIGIDAEGDRERFPFITEQGVVVLPKGTHVPREGPVEFAYDIEEMMRNDEKLSPQLAEFSGRYTVSAQQRHSYQSAGPRFRRYGHPESE